MKHFALRLSFLVAPLSFLGIVAGTARADMVRFREEFPPEKLVLKQWDVPGETTKITSVRFQGADSFDEPGLPRLPCVLRRLAIPLGATIVRLNAAASGLQYYRGHSLIEWQGGFQPGGRVPRPPYFDIDDAGKPVYYRLDDTPVALSESVLALPSWPPEHATILGTAEQAGYQVVTIRVQPVLWAPKSGDLTLASALTISLEHEGGRVPDFSKATHAQVMELEGLRAGVANAHELPEYATPLPLEKIEAPYLIITDNRKWNEDKTPGDVLAGDMVAEFERLARWKTQKGVKARVVTVSEIFSGRYGNFNTISALDTQEVLRNFLKHAREAFHSYWILLGGDVSVIPPRYVVANCYSGSHFFLRVDEAKPEPGQCYWDADGQRVRIHHASYVTPDMKLVSAKSGRAFERKSSPSASSPGWEYVTNNGYSSASVSQTDYIRLAGPLADVELTHFYAIIDWNQIPTDLYYASIDSPLYGQAGKHDWDLTGNGIYGQYDGATSIDGVAYSPNLSVGRAPVETVNEARAFVDKLLAYERYEGMYSSLGRKLLLGQSNWSSSPTVTQDAANPPAEEKYYSATGSTTTRCHFNSAPESTWAFDLIAYDAPGDHWEVPYNSGASATSLGYYFTTDDSYGTVSTRTIQFQGKTIRFPRPTRFVVVKGPSGLVRPAMFFFEEIGPDQAVTEKEEVKDLLATSSPSLDIRKRLYWDFDDTPDHPAPDLFELGRPAMKAELDAGYNLVSLTGHGNWKGCSGVQYADVAALTNGFNGGVVYADSCLTAQFDVDDAAGEYFLKTAAGGAVGYVGNSRFSWVGTGHGFETAFWECFASCRHLGVMFDTKRYLTGTDRQRWANFSLNLLGCPEMPVWRGIPLGLRVVHPQCVRPDASFQVTVTSTAGDPLFWATVCLTDDSGLFKLYYTGPAGVTPPIPVDWEDPQDMVLTVTVEDHLPYQAEIDVGRCRFVRGDANDDGRLDISDATYVLGFLFLGTRGPPCDDAADTNDDGKMDISDPLRLLGFLFLGQRLPPGVIPGRLQEDTTLDDLGCGD